MCSRDLNSGTLTVEHSINHLQFTASDAVFVTKSFSGVQARKEGSDSNHHARPPEALGQGISLVFAERFNVGCGAQPWTYPPGNKQSISSKCGTKWP